MTNRRVLGYAVVALAVLTIVAFVGIGYATRAPAPIEIAPPMEAAGTSPAEPSRSVSSVEAAPVLATPEPAQPIARDVVYPPEAEGKAAIPVPAAAEQRTQALVDLRDRRKLALMDQLNRRARQVSR